MREFLDFDKNYSKHLRIFYYAFSALGIYGNFVDMLTYDRASHFLFDYYDACVIFIIVFGIIAYRLQKISLKTAFILTLYSNYIVILLSLSATLWMHNSSSLYLLRESLYTCFLITAAYLFLTEIHGLVMGLFFVGFITMFTIVSKNQYLINNLPGIVILYFSYILILNYFHRYLKFSIIKANEDGQIIKAQNERLTSVNLEQNESQRQINTQNEELLSLSESISEQNKILEQQNAKLEEAIQQKSKLFSIIAHDIKSPLFSLGSLTELMLERYDELSEEKKKSFLSKMVHSNKALQILLENLLTWSLSQTGIIELKSEKIELSETIHKVIAIYYDYAASKSVQLVSKVDQPLYIMADRMMIETILRNLVSNAIKYSYEQGIVNIGAEQTDSNIKIFVQDNGVGIEAERLQTLFSYSNDIITLGTIGEKGTGLGLRICKEFIEKLHGTISIESQEKRGTILFIILPLTMT